MDRLTVQQIPDRGFRSLRIVCGALAASLGLYVVLAWALTDRVGVVLDDGNPALAALPWVLAGFGLASVLAASPFSRTLLERAARRSGGDGERLLTAYSGATIIGFALREAAGVSGLAASLLTGEPLWCLILSAVAFTAMVRAWPSRSHLQRSIG